MGVGTNRIAYSGNDSVNLRDLGWNASVSDFAYISDDVRLSDGDKNAGASPPLHIDLLSQGQRH